MNIPANEASNEAFNAARLKFLPTTRSEMERRGWSELDVLLVTGDAYIDHPSFGVATLGRWLERLGFRVGVLAQPRFGGPEALTEWRRMGRPKLFVGVSAGTVDSMINNYTANKKSRSDDMYSPGARAGLRPDYASVVYAKLAKQAFPDTPLVVGGVEASLRRLAHYDYWQNRIRPSIVSELGCELLVFGMGEKTGQRIAEELNEAAAGGVASTRDAATLSALSRLRECRGVAYLTTREAARELQPRLTLPSFEEVRDDKRKFAKAAYFIEYEASPFNGKRLVQHHGRSAVVVNPPALPLNTAELDSIYELPFCKDQHPSYQERIPATDMIRFSVAAVRGCFGGCSFCAITLHQGRVVQSRSESSVLNEVAKLCEQPEFKGIVSDIGGPTANMYGLHCKSADIQGKCRKLSCVHPRVCPHLQSDHLSQIRLLKKARVLPGIRKINVASGLRYDLAMADQKSGGTYLRELVSHHVGGQLKVAPEHTDSEVLELMRKPGFEEFEKFSLLFEEYSREAGKEQYLVPYFISAFPGSGPAQMEKVHEYLKERGWHLQQVQAFIPTPMTLATAMYWTGIDPMTRKQLYVAKNWRDRKLQQALLQPQKPEHKKILADYRSRKRRSRGGV